MRAGAATATVAAGCRGAAPAGAVATERGGAGAGRGAAISSRTGSSTLSSPFEPMAKRLSPSADNTCAASALSSAIVSAVAVEESPAHPAKEETARHATARLRNTPDIRTHHSRGSGELLRQSCHHLQRTAQTRGSRRRCRGTRSWTHRVMGEVFSVVGHRVIGFRLHP